MDPKVADDLLQKYWINLLLQQTVSQILNTQRPNIIFIILESFSTHLMETMGSDNQMWQ